MPLVTISILKGKSPEYIKAVADGINSAVIETMAFPDDDRYQIIHQLDPECLQLQTRDEDRVMMHLVMRAGRSNKSKQAFYRKAVENLAQNPGIKPANVLITITENHVLTGLSATVSRSLWCSGASCYLAWGSLLRIC